MRCFFLCCLLPFGILITLHPVSALALDPDDDTPVLIQKASPAIQKAWRQVNLEIEKNKALKPPLPEPYQARAEIWALVGNHDDALADQLRALELLYDRKPSLLDQTRSLKKMQDTLDQVRKQPRPYYPLDADMLFYLGKKYYFQCHFSAALKEFNEALRLNPDEPLFWYYRAVTNKQLGKDSEADRDARAAISLRRASKSRKEIPRELERIQGGLRVWLNEVALQRPTSSSR